jgi:hypothetical protein
MANALKKITDRAKQIRKKQPGKKWATAVKEAGRDYRAGKISGTKSPRKISGAKKKSPAKKRSIGSATPPTGGSLEAQLKKKLTEQLGWMLVQVRTAKGVTQKRALNKKAAEITKKLRALS